MDYGGQLDFPTIQPESGTAMSITNCIFVVVLFMPALASSRAASAQKVDCEKAQNTAEQAQCADSELGVAESEMKGAFGHALEVYIPTAQEKKQTAALPKLDRDRQTDWERKMLRDLRASQNTWLAYRQSACGAAEDMYDGGTISAVAVGLCRAEMTRAQTKFLRDYFGNDQ